MEQTTSPTRRMPGTGILITVGAVIIVTVGTILVLGPPGVVRYEPGTPEAAAQAYIQTLFDGDYDVAYGLLAAELQEDCSPNELGMGYEGQNHGAAVFENVTITGDRATIDLRMRAADLTFEPPLPVADAEVDTRLVLERRDGEWRIVSAGYALYGCTWR